MAEQADNPNRGEGPGLLVIISGPSGVGKTTIARAVETTLGAEFSVSLTTRPKTPSDVPGRDYHFVSREEFEHRRDADQLLEWAEVFDNFYGTPREPVDRAIAEGRLMILEIDVQGAVQVKQKLPEAFGIFILPPSDQALLDRLRGRGRDEEQVIQRRFSRAKAEIQRAHDSGVYDRFIVNDELEQAIRQTFDAVREEWQRRREQAPR